MKQTTNITLTPIGTVKVMNETMSLVMAEEFRAGLIELDTFSHCHVLFRGNGHDNEKDREDAAEFFSSNPVEG